MIGLRPGRHEDVPELARVVAAAQATHREWAGPHTPLLSLAEEELEWDLRFARASATVIVAEDDADGSIVGVAAYAGGTVSREDRTPVPGLGHINAVFVDPAHFRRGIARLLLEAAEASMHEQGYERAQLFTLEGSPAEHLYNAQGWSRDGRRDHYPPMGLDVVAYVKDLRGPPATRT